MRIELGKDIKTDDVVGIDLSEFDYLQVEVNSVEETQRAIIHLNKVIDSSYKEVIVSNRPKSLLKNIGVITPESFLANINSICKDKTIIYLDNLISSKMRAVEARPRMQDLVNMMQKQKSKYKEIAFVFIGDLLIEPKDHYKMKIKTKSNKMIARINGAEIQLSK